jgi:hypothetical protein
MYIIKYVVFDYLPDEDKFPCRYNITSRMVKTRQPIQDKIKIFLKPKYGKE